jgi:hypothetical protein
MLKRTVPSICLAVSFLAGPSDAQAQTILDQIQPIIDSSAGALAIGGTSEQRLMQTLTVGVSGTWTGVYLPITCPSGKVVIDVHPLTAGVVGPSIKRKAFRTGSDPEIIGRFRLFSLGTGLTVTVGQEYALVLANTGGECSISSGPIGNPYAGGEGYFEALPNPPGFVPFSSFPDARRDLPFQTVIRR